MECADVSALVEKLRAAGAELWVEDGKIRGRMRAGGRPPYGVAVMMEDLRDLGMIAVEYLERESSAAQTDGDQNVLPEPDAEGIVRLVGVPPEVAFAAGDLINDGKAVLIGKVIYRRLSNVFDVTYRVVEP